MSPELTGIENKHDLPETADTQPIRTTYRDAARLGVNHSSLASTLSPYRRYVNSNVLFGKWDRRDVLELNEGEFEPLTTWTRIQVNADNLTQTAAGGVWPLRCRRLELYRWQGGSRSSIWCIYLRCLQRAGKQTSMEFY
ncbi:unnamed protein product [Colias eurytheme]|nr:unnamed protein product [Colias eurytheme]